VEWALDPVESCEAIWLPRETQLRELLAGTFRGLDRTEPGGGADRSHTPRHPAVVPRGFMLF
jgi:hypothetical protein